jgi:hypothetical protein
VIKGKIASNNTIQITDSRGKKTGLTIQVLPRIATYDCTIKVGESCEIPFATSGVGFEYNQENYVIGSSNAQGNLVLQGKQAGNVLISAKKDGILKANITVHILENPSATNVQTITKDMTAFAGEYVYIPMTNPSQYMAVSTQGGIVELSNNPQYIVFKGIKAGTTSLILSKGTTRYFVYNITIQDKQPLTTI